MTSTDLQPQIALLFDQVHTASPSHYGILSGWQWEIIRGKLLRAGFDPGKVVLHLLSSIENGSASLGEVNLIVGFGEKVLRHYTDKKGIDKWQLSPLTTHDGRKFIPTFDMSRVQKQFELGLYQELALLRAHNEFASRVWHRAEERFLLNPSIEETMAVLDAIKDKEEIAVDVETGYGQINTVGLAWSESDAIAINVLPDRCRDEVYFALMSKIGDVLQSESRKIFQNFIYDVSYFSAYGIGIRGEIFDTMWAMKVLWPEFKSNLGNVGRIYTNRPYWKDDGRVTDEEGAKKSWGNIRDWMRHYRYNACDTTGTFEAARNQKRDLEQRGLLAFFNNYLSRLKDPIREMCANGMPLCLDTRSRLKTELESKIAELTKDLHREAGFELNPRSPKQVLGYLRSKKINIPKKYDKEKGAYKETADATSIKKIRLKHPELKSLSILAEVKSLDTALSRYIDFEVRPDGRLSYSLNGCGTETLRWSGNKDAWDRGFNIQTIPREGGDVSIKQMFHSPGGFSFLEIDLRQAESRFVAYDSDDKTLIDMLESDADVHRYVAAEIFKKSGADITRDERQLGKKAGHGANYAMKAGVFVETCFTEMDLVLSRKEAENILESYHRLFPGIRRWHASIKKELWSKRKLSAPSGWERYFYGRYGDDMFKEAFAWRPQHTIPWITNHLMLHLIDERKRGAIKFQLLVQVHDSLILLVPDDQLEAVAKVCHANRNWHPRVPLTGGDMWIPVETKAGKQMSSLKEWGNV